MTSTLIVQTEKGYFPQLFKSIDELCAHHLSSGLDPTRAPSHYELIEGEQCLYFDFDGQVDLVQVIDRIYSYLSYYSINWTILIYSSCDSTKQSYHILVRGLHFASHIGCGKVAKLVCEGLPNFDKSIYTTKRNFRMLGSRKRDGTRIKRFHSIHNNRYYKPSEVEHLTLKDSLVSYVDHSRSTCFDSDVPVVAPQMILCSQVIWTPEKIREGLDLVEKLFPGVFKQDKVDGHYLRLKRLKSHHCPLCERTHDSDGGSLVLRQSSFSFRCWRDDDKRLYPLSGNGEDEDETLEIEVVEREEELDEFETSVKAMMEHIHANCKFS
jgi:hypothetical protein